MKRQPQQVSGLLISLAILLTTASALSAIPFFQINNKYIQTGSYTYSTTALYNNLTANSLGGLSFTNTLTALHTSYLAVSSIQTLNFQITALKEFNISNFVCGYYTTKLVNCLMSRQFSSLSALSIRYLVLDAPYVDKMTHMYASAIFYVQNYTTKPFNSTSPIVCNFGLTPNNITGQVKSYVFLNGMNGTSTLSSMEFDIKLSSSYPSSGVFKVVATTSSTANIDIGAFVMILMGFNVGQASVWPFPAMRVDDGVFSPTSPYLDTNNTFRTYNTFWGPTGMGVGNQNFIQWSSTFAVNTSMTASSANPYNHYQWLGLVFWVKQCKPLTPYYMIINDTCYDPCPNYYWEDSVNWLCQLCTAYDCLKCVQNQTCTLCDNVTAHREINTTSLRCVPLPGYYQTGETIAPPCDFNCSTCSNTSVYCTSCNVSYFLDTLSTHQCLPCEPNCNNCTSNTTCLSCLLPYSLDATNTSCIVNCSLAIDNCTSCTTGQGIVCTQCVLGFYLNNTANICTVSCGDGVLATTEACDDGNLNDGDGCSSNCTIQSAFFCTGNVSDESVCAGCSADCLNCSSLTNCTLCDSTTMLSSAACVPNCSVITNCVTCQMGQGYLVCNTCTEGLVVNATNFCEGICGDGIIGGSQICDDKNINDGDGCSSNCTIQSAYYCLGTPSECGHCPTYCYACNDSVNCTQCDVLAPWNATVSLCQPNCTQLTDCLSCQIATGAIPPYISCLTCNLGYALEDTSNLCSAICGDGILVVNQTCDDNNTNDGDGCSSTCTIQPFYYCSGAPSSCVACMTYCYACNDSVNCSQCDTLAPWNVSTSVCQPNCTQVTDCSSCRVETASAASYVVCVNCSLGFGLDSSNNVCLAVCGDGILVGNQTCDDNNTVNGDGCSSTCLIQPAFYCVSATGPSVCTACLTYCFSCVDNLSCTTCDSVATWNATSLSCQPNCSVVLSCSSCLISASNTPAEFVQCSLCLTGLVLDYQNNVCNAICGDSLILGSQTCDDGNAVGGDGCSSSCNIEAGYYCEGEVSVCAKCMQYCLVCTDGISCDQCNAITIWDSTNSICFANCSTVNQCNTCTLSNSNNADYIQCLTCSGGYSVDNSVNLCKPICGDGVVAPEEQCDDGNLAVGDGCDTLCLVQTYFSCNTSAQTNSSQCFLTTLTLTLVDITKDDNRNSGTMHLKPSPDSLPIYNTINWKDIITFPNSSVTITDITYDPTTNLITVNFDYSTSLQDQTLQIEVNTANNTHLSQISPFNVTLKAVADDNQALVYYEDSQYSNTKIVAAVSKGLGGVAFAFLIAGAFGGRLIGLQCAAVIQVAYISTLTLQNLSPSFKSLQQLYLCFGYNKLKSYDYSQPIQRPLKGGQIDKMFIYNYNMMGLLIVLPPLAAIFSKIMARKRQKENDKEKQNFWLSNAKYAIGEFTLYAMLSFGYLAYLSLFVQLKYMQSSTFDFVGVGTGVTLILLAVFYLGFYAKADSFYTEFKEKFNPDAFGRRFYIFPILQRILTPAVLSMMLSKSYGNAAIIGLYAAMGTLIVVKQPYKGDKKNYRPVANYLIAILIQLIYLIVGISNDPTSFLSLNGPMVVIVMLIVCVLYSAYALVQDLRQKISKCKKDEAPDDEMEMKEMAKYFRDENSIMMKSNLLQNGNNPLDTSTVPNSPHSVVPPSPTFKQQKINLSTIKDMLQDKKTGAEQVTAAQQIDVSQFHEMLDNLQQSI